jgi:hypothetical protein
MAYMKMLTNSRKLSKAAGAIKKVFHKAAGMENCTSGVLNLSIQ